MATRIHYDIVGISGSKAARVYVTTMGDDMRVEAEIQDANGLLEVDEALLVGDESTRVDRSQWVLRLDAHVAELRSRFA
jgi:hypothetical protein